VKGEKEMKPNFERYEGTFWNRTKLLVRGFMGVILLIPLAGYLLSMTILLTLLEAGNLLMDEIEKVYDS